MDPTNTFPPEILSTGMYILALTFGTVFAMNQAGLPPKWSYLAAIGVGLGWGVALGLVFFGPTQYAAMTALLGAFMGLPTQSASRRPAEKIVTDGVAKLGTPETTASIVVTTPDPAPPGSTTVVTTNPDTPAA